MIAKQPSLSNLRTIRLRRRATDTEAVRNLGRTDALGLEAADLIRVDRGLAAPVDALHLRALAPVVRLQVHGLGAGMPAVRHAQGSKGRGDGLASVLQLSPPSFDAGLSEPHELREGSRK